MTCDVSRDFAVAAVLLGVIASGITLSTVPGRAARPVETDGKAAPLPPPVRRERRSATGPSERTLREGPALRGRAEGQE